MGLQGGLELANRHDPHGPEATMLCIEAMYAGGAADGIRGDIVSRWVRSGGLNPDQLVAVYQMAVKAVFSQPGLDMARAWFQIGRTALMQLPAEIREPLLQPQPSTVGFGGELLPRRR